MTQLQTNGGRRTQRRFPGFLGLLALAALFASCGEIEEGTAPPRNLVLVVIDTLRADYLALHGGEVQTPNLESLAAAGVVFDQAYSHIPVTGPSHSSLMTGLLPIDHGVQANTQILPAERTTLAEILRDAGYSTSAVVSLGVLRRDYGFDQGFDSYEDSFPRQWFRNADEILESLEPWFERQDPEPYFLWTHFSDPHEPYTSPDDWLPTVRTVRDGEELGTASTNGYRASFEAEWPPGVTEVRFEPADPESSTALAESLVAFRNLRVRSDDIETTLVSGWTRHEEGGRPAKTTLPATIQVENRTDQAIRTDLRFSVELVLTHDEIRAAYAREIEFVDRKLGELIDRLEQRDSWDNTLLVLTSDHGEAIFEHGRLGHVHQVYEESSHVPLIMVAPGLLPQGRVVEAPASHIDVLPTILELLELQPADAMRGTSLMPLIEKPTTKRRRVLMTTFQPFALSDIRALRYGPYKLIRTEGPDQDLELYDLEADPLERDDLSDSQPDVIRGMTEILDQELNTKLTEGRTARDAELSEEEREQLEALGYVK